MAWYKEPRRHSLAAKGIKTSIDKKPISTCQKQVTKKLIQAMKEEEKAPKTIPMRVVMAANQDAGKYFFSDDTMNFFNSRVGGTAYLIPGSDTEGYFITSEKSPYEKRRKYSIRKFDLSTGSVWTKGKFQDYNTEKQAEDALQELLK